MDFKALYETISKKILLRSTMRCSVKKYDVFIPNMDSFCASSVFLFKCWRRINSFPCTIIFISHGNKRIRRVTEGFLSFLLMLSHPVHIVIKSLATLVNIAYSFVDVLSGRCSLCCSLSNYLDVGHIGILDIFNGYQKGSE